MPQRMWKEEYSSVPSLHAENGRDLLLHHEHFAKTLFSAKASESSHVYKLDAGSKCFLFRK